MPFGAQRSNQTMPLSSIAAQQASELQPRATRDPKQNASDVVLRRHLGALVIACSGFALLAGCGSRGGGTASPSSNGSTTSMPSSGSTGAAAGTAPGGATSPSVALIPERKFLSDWFSGTPVTIDFDREGALRVDVPLQYAFDPRQSKLKPALSKVLDHVGTSLRRVPTSRVHVSAPPDTGAVVDTALAGKRATAVRDGVVSKGVNAIRIASVTPSTTGSVQIRILMPSP